MDVVGHLHRAMQDVEVMNILPVQEGRNNQIGDLRPGQVGRASDGLVQQAIHGHEDRSGVCCACREVPVLRQAALQTPSNEQGFPVRVPMRKSAVVGMH